MNIEEKNLIKIDGILWNRGMGRILEPLCPIHRLRLSLYPEDVFGEYQTNALKCEECENIYVLPRAIANEKKYIINKIDSKYFKQMRILNLDDESMIIIEDKFITKDNKFFVTALITDSKVGKRLVVYAGEKGKKEKTQIFIEPEIKRLAFDQKDLHPSEVFSKLEAVFKDGTRHSIKSGKK